MIVLGKELVVGWVVLVVLFILRLDISTINDYHALPIYHQDAKASYAVDVYHRIVKCAFLQQGPVFQYIKIGNFNLLYLSVNFTLNNSRLHKPLLYQVVSKIVYRHGSSYSIFGIADSPDLDNLLVV